MDKLAAKIHDLLARSFRGADVILNPPAEDKRLSGFVVWAGFSRLDQLARQHRLHKALDEQLSSAERERLSHLFPLTPAEWKTYEQNRLQEEEEILHTAATIRRERAKRRRFLAGLKQHG